MSDISVFPIRLQATAEALRIEWNDGKVQELSWPLLRKKCPCATCQTTPPAAPPSGGLAILTLAEARPLRVSSVQPIGNYAYHLEFTDGHTTGIYTLEYLRTLS